MLIKRGHELLVVDSATTAAAFLEAPQEKDGPRRLPFSPQTVRVSHTNHRERLSSDPPKNLGVVRLGGKTISQKDRVTDLRLYDHRRM